MAHASDDRPFGFLLTDAEVEEFRALAREHAGAELTVDEAQSVAAQILCVLAIVRNVAWRHSTDSVSSVDGEVLSESTNRAITNPPAT